MSLLLGLLLLVNSASAAEGPEAGELVVGAPSIVAGATSETNESVHFHYAYGSIGHEGTEANRATEKILAGILDALPESATAQEPQVIDVFAKDTPADLRQARRMVTRLRGVARGLKLHYGDRVDRIAIELVPVPEKLATAETTIPKSLGAEFRRGLVRPSEFAVHSGAIIGTYRAITSLSTWISMPGIHPLTVTGIVAYQTGISSFHAIFSRSMANVFRLNLISPGGPPIRSSTLFARRQLYAVILTEITRLITGTPPGSDPITTWQGQAQILSLCLTIGGLDSLFMTVRDREFLEDPLHFARLYLANFMLLTPWQLLDTAGTFPVLLDLTFYKVRLSTIGMLLTYFSLYQSVSRAPGKVALVLDATIGPLERAVATLSRSIGRSCKSLFHAP